MAVKKFGPEVMIIDNVGGINMDCENVDWFTRLSSVTDKEISEVESKLGIKFPEDYKKCTKMHHGGRPRPRAFDFSARKGAVFNRLLTFNPEDSYYIPTNLDWVKDRLIDDIYPFAEDPFGNLICFDYREGKNKSPKVIFWDHEIASRESDDGIFYICDSFTELISKLYSDE